MANTAAAQNTFRVVDGKYVHNNEEISKAEFDKRKADVDSAIRNIRGSSNSSGQNSKSMTPEERKAKAFAEMDGMKKGGKVKSASSRGDGIAQRGKTKGRMV